MEQPKEQNYLHGAVILTLGVIITKILGAIYKIPLGNILGDDGYAYFYSAYSVYYVFLIMATAGLPVAVSRMVAEANEQGRIMQSRRIFSVERLDPMARRSWSASAGEKPAQSTASCISCSWNSGTPNVFRSAGSIDGWS